MTGASGFIGAHVVVQLLDAGYSVRGYDGPLVTRAALIGRCSTARGAKLELLREHFKSIPQFEAVQIDDIVAGDFTAALKGESLSTFPAGWFSKLYPSGVSAVIHLASPLAGRETPEAGLNVCSSPSLCIHAMILNARRRAPLRAP